MEFRPCIDIHNGKVKQIVGGSLKDAGSRAKENFVSEQDAAFYARFYRESGIRGGHIILLNKEGKITKRRKDRRFRRFMSIREACRSAAVSGQRTPGNIWRREPVM